MNDFDFDVLEKKRIAASARHRVCGSKSKHCFLPSDRLTKAQLAKRNGPVATFNMSGPMSWDMFDQLPQDLKGEYLIGLRDRFNPSPRPAGAHVRPSRSDYPAKPPAAETAGGSEPPRQDD